MSQSNYIKVLVDVIPTMFDEREITPYQYANIRAINSNEQETLDQCLQNMRENDSPLLFDEEMILFSEIKNIKFDRECFFNLTTQMFEFR